MAQFRIRISIDDSIVNHSNVIRSQKSDPMPMIHNHDVIRNIPIFVEAIKTTDTLQ